MSVVFAQVASQDYFIRNDALRRRSAEVAYDRHENYNKTIQEKLARLESFIRGDEEPEAIATSVTKEQAVSPQEENVVQLEAGQMKRISLPLGKTLEETIRLWRDVRADAISAPQPTPTDYHLASKASGEIRKAEAQLGLHDKARVAVDSIVFENEMDITTFQTAEERELHKIQKRYEQAISSYAYHAQMKQSGFELVTPSFYTVA